MSKLVVQRVREYLVLDKHEVKPPAKALPAFKRCTIKGNLSMWEQGCVCGYMQVRGEPYAVVTYTERPEMNDLPQFDIVRIEKVRAFRKVVAREFTL